MCLSTKSWGELPIVKSGEFKICGFVKGALRNACCDGDKFPFIVVSGFI